MAPDFAVGARQKLSRARTHITEIEKLISAYIKRRPFSWVTADSEEDGCTDIRLKIDEPIPLEIAVVVGDALHNMRSSLDNLASALAVHNGVTSNSILRNVYFPIGQNKKDFEDACTSLVPFIGQSSASAVSKTEVFIGGKGEVLKRLGEMSNADKHRLLIPTVPAMEGTLRIGFADSEPLPADFEGEVEFCLGELGNGKIPAKDGDLLLTYRQASDPRFFISYQPALTVSLDFVGLKPGESVTNTLERMRALCLSAVDQAVYNVQNESDSRKIKL